jgi:hypothetical protein
VISKYDIRIVLEEQYTLYEIRSSEQLGAGNSLLGQSALRNLLLGATSVDLVVNWRVTF